MLFNLCHFARLCCALLVLVMGVQARWDTPHDAAPFSVAAVDLTSADGAGAGAEAEAAETPAEHEHETAGDHAALIAESPAPPHQPRPDLILAPSRAGDPQGRPTETLKRPPKAA